MFLVVINLLQFVAWFVQNGDICRVCFGNDVGLFGRYHIISYFINFITKMYKLYATCTHALKKSFYKSETNSLLYSNRIKTNVLSL